jgi:GT2 family glycosyltransferase
MKYTPKDVTFVMPSYNTLNYTMMAYRSLREFYPNNEIIILDDGSNDGSAEYLEAQIKLDDNLRMWANKSGNILGHTVTYDMGIKMATKPLVTIFHSDMICAKNYLENMLKHYDSKKVICATRIEPDGIYPASNEKILKNFGIEYHEFKREEFTKFVEEEQVSSKDKTTNSIFAPWLISKEDFLAIGGHDAFHFAPYPEEDADIFLRFHMAGYELIQSRDSLCWHWISRGHRSWAKNGVGKDDDKFLFYQTRARRNYIRKWHRLMLFNEFHHPIKHPVYNIGFVLSDVTSEDFLHFIEPWANHIYVDNMVCAERYIAKEQPTTKVDLKKRIMNHGYIEQNNNDILLYFSQKDFMSNGNDNVAIIIQLCNIIAEGVEDNSEMELGIFKMKTKTVKDISNTLIKI